jgi:hypothetical protein
MSLPVLAHFTTIRADLNTEYGVIRHRVAAHAKDTLSTKDIRQNGRW